MATDNLQPTTYNLKLLKVFLLLLVVLSLVIGPTALAQTDLGPDPSTGGIGGLVRCGRELDAQGNLKNPCDWKDLVATAQNLVNWLVYISVFVAAAMFTYAGYLYVTSMGSEEQLKKAHEVFRNVLIGFLLVLAAWLVVYTISITVLKDTNILLLDSGN